MLIPRELRLLTDRNNERLAEPDRVPLTGPASLVIEGFSANAFALPALDTIAKIPIHNIDFIAEFFS